MGGLPYWVAARKVHLMYVLQTCAKLNVKTFFLYFVALNTTCIIPQWIFGWLICFGEKWGTFVSSRSKYFT